ncbi:sulfotransferase [Virgisporangium aliadipatigenens]|uniref:Sulfotransferase n=1 Tax=Virgisporangium aliadipatigenens TaxID=741659 RepID=A0A8J3YUH5_9ACTN|nr:sulfotransferase [Virgisporangium aliadipatigenens]GIJ51914.1 sulfotransferase [Virgisporangium aliadipatigenens]
MGVPVVGIMGTGRSGSTLLEFLLAARLRDARAVGELDTIVTRSYQDAEPCSCGKPAVDCPEWTAVLTALVADPAHEEWVSLVENRRGWRRFCLRLGAAALRRRWTGRAGRPPRGLAAYDPVLDALRALAAGHDTLLDNSKTPLHFYALASTGAVDLRVVHLLRRPQAVVWSWRRRKPLPESGDRNWHMEPRSALRTGAAWCVNAVQAALFRRLFPDVPYVRMSYDELCADPAGAVDRCVRALGLLDAGEVRRDAPRAYHVLGGNPARFGGFGQVTLDDEWRRRLSRPVRVWLGAVASPLYRILLRGHRP